MIDGLVVKKERVSNVLELMSGSFSLLKASISPALTTDAGIFDSWARSLSRPEAGAFLKIHYKLRPLMSHAEIKLLQSAFCASSLHNLEPVKQFLMDEKHAGVLAFYEENMTDINCFARDFVRFSKDLAESQEKRKEQRKQWLKEAQLRREKNQQEMQKTMDELNALHLSEAGTQPPPPVIIHRPRPRTPVNFLLEENNDVDTTSSVKKGPGLRRTISFDADLKLLGTSN